MGHRGSIPIYRLAVYMNKRFKKNSNEKKQKKNTEKFSDKAKNQKDADIFQTTHHRITQQ